MEARRLGVKAQAVPDGIKLPSLTGAAGLDRRNEHEFQVEVVRDYRRALTPTCDVIAVPNQRFMGHLSKAHRLSILRNLTAEGMRVGTHDTLFEWDARNGAPGNLGCCWIELKRAVDPEPVKQAQIDFMLERRAMGRVAGWAQCLEHIDALLDEAGAPLRWRSPARDVPPWWHMLGEHPPLFGSIAGVVRLPGGGTLRLGQSA